MFKNFIKFKKYVKETKKKKLIYIFSILLLLEIISGGFLIYYILLLSGIENLIRYIVIVFLLLMMILFINKYMKVLMKPKKKVKSRITFLLFIILIILVQGYASYAIYNVYSPINKINKSTITYTSNLIVMSDSEIESVEDLSNNKIGYINNETSIEDNEIALNLIDEHKLDKHNEVLKYDQYFDMVNDLYNGELDAIIISSNYSTMFSSIDKFTNIKEEVKVISKKSMEFKKKKEQLLSKNIIEEPFTVLLMGVDSEFDGLDKDAAFNGDSLMLITFNPNTLNATVLSIPRDTYVPIACFKNKKKNKITHASWQGVECMEQTIEDFTGINIDYHVKMNFKGVVDLVDALGGIEVDVPLTFCEQDSNRMWGEHEICVEKGMQVLNGEQALALARHRKTLTRGDIERALNQQLVIEGMLKKLSSINSVEKVNSLLDAISKNMDTNITTNQILSFYNVGKDVLLKSAHTTTSDLISMEQLFISGYDKMIYDPDFDLTLYNYVPYKTSIEAVSNKMKENLELKKVELIKTFDFSINNVYEKTIVGENITDNKSNVEDTEQTDSLPDFVGKTKSYAESVLKSYKFDYEFEEVKKGDKLYDESYDDGEIISQSQKAGIKTSKIKKLVLKYIVKDKEDNDSSACPKDTTNTKCFLPDFVGETRSVVENWAKSLPVSIHIEYQDLSKTDKLYDKTLAGTFGKMNYSKGTNLSEITTLILYEKKSVTNNNDSEEEENTTFTVTCEVENGKSSTYTVNKGGTFSPPSNPCDAGYTFSGWSLNGSLITSLGNINANMKLTGKCTKQEDPLDQIMPDNNTDNKTEGE